MKVTRQVVENPFVITVFDPPLTSEELKGVKEEIAAAGGYVAYAEREGETTRVGWRSGKSLDMIVAGPFEVGA